MSNDEIEIISDIEDDDSFGSENISLAETDQVDDFDIELVGRPSKLTDDTVRKLSSALKMGLSQK